MCSLVSMSMFVLGMRPLQKYKGFCKPSLWLSVCVLTLVKLRRYRQRAGYITQQITLLISMDGKYANMHSIHYKDNLFDCVKHVFTYHFNYAASIPFTHTHTHTLEQKHTQKMYYLICSLNFPSLFLSLTHTRCVYIYPSPITHVCDSATCWLQCPRGLLALTVPLNKLLAVHRLLNATPF